MCARCRGSLAAACGASRTPPALEWPATGSVALHHCFSSRMSCLRGSFDWSYNQLAWPLGSGRRHIGKDERRPASPAPCVPVPGWRTCVQGVECINDSGAAGCGRDDRPGGERIACISMQTPADGLPTQGGYPSVDVAGSRVGVSEHARGGGMNAMITSSLHPRGSWINGATSPRKILNALLTIVLIASFNFVLFRILPGDPARLLVPKGRFSMAAMAKQRADFHLEQAHVGAVRLLLEGHRPAQVRRLLRPEAPGGPGGRRAHLADRPAGRHRHHHRDRHRTRSPASSPAGDETASST